MPHVLVRGAIAAFCLGVMLTVSMAAIAGSREEICKDPLLSHQEQGLCAEQMAAAQSVAEQKQIQAKFRDRIAKRKAK